MKAAVDDSLLKYSDFLGAVKHMQNNKAPGTNGITAGILKLGAQVLVSVMIPLCRTARVWGVIPSNWNTVVIQLM